MFTGIIQDIGTVRSIDKKGDWRIEIETALDLSRAAIGASISCSGACLTVTQKGANWFAVDVSGETLSKTSISDWDIGMKINLEPSLRLGDELGGHLVSGHVDGLVRIKEITADKESHVLKIEYAGAQDFARFIAPKGSVTLDGISLTINDVAADYFTVNIIPHTWRRTTLDEKKPGDVLNLEIDMLARYVANMIGKAA